MIRFLTIKLLGIYKYTYCKVRNINMELLLATLASGSDSPILRSVHICSIYQRFFYALLCPHRLVVQNICI